MTESIRVFLLDDHEIVRRGLADLLGAEPGIVVVGEAREVAGTAAAIVATGATVAVLDGRLPDGSGIDVCRDVKTADPSIGCIILASYKDDEAELAAVLAGADGYLLKEVRAKRLIDSIRRVATGQSLVDATVLQRAERARTTRARGAALEAHSPITRLAPPERELLALIAQGLTNRAIAERLSLTERTVRSRVAGVLEALGVRRRTQAKALIAELQRGEIGQRAP